MTATIPSADTVDPANQATGAQTTRAAAAIPTKRPPSAVPATQVRAAAPAEASAARRTRLWTVLNPVTARSPWPTVT